MTGLPLGDVAGTARTLPLIIVTATAAAASSSSSPARIVAPGAAPAAPASPGPRPGRGADLDRVQVALGERVPGRIADPPHEVGQVASALNPMLDHVEGALTAARATRPGSGASSPTPATSCAPRWPRSAATPSWCRRRPDPLPADVAAALGRVESEAGRMGGLVDELLLLARLDSGRDVRRAPVDLVPVVVATPSPTPTRPAPTTAGCSTSPTTTRSSSGRRGPAHPGRRQPAGNARVHTPAGTRVDVRLARDGDDAVLTVTDDGPGVPEDLRDAVFERFTRGDTSRGAPRAAPGSACRSSGPSSRPTAARSPARRRRGARPSWCACRWPSPPAADPPDTSTSSWSPDQPWPTDQEQVAPAGGRQAQCLVARPALANRPGTGGPGRRATGPVPGRPTSPGQPTRNRKPPPRATDPVPGRPDQPWPLTRNRGRHRAAASASAATCSDDIHRWSWRPSQPPHNSPSDGGRERRAPRPPGTGDAP